MRKVPQLNIEIRNSSNDEAVIDIDGEIGWASYDGEEYNWNTASAIKKKLKDISNIKASRIIVNINSLGGYVDDGLAIHDALASHEAEIETRVTGMTASAATIIAQAGDVRKMSDNALYLIHHAWGMSWGNVNEMEAAVEDLKVIDKRLLNIYVKRTGKSEKELTELMAENNGTGKWIDADEAKEYGLIDESFEPMKAAASVNMNSFKAMKLPVPDSEKFNVIDATSKDSENEDVLITKLADKVLEIVKAKENESNDSEREAPVEGIDLDAQAREREAEILTK